MRWRDLTGDLDAITLKALRAEAESRYLSAAAFADDLRRWLAGEPVAARRGDRSYRLTKLVARHRVALAAAAAILVALAAGVSVALVQRSRALADRARAEATVADLHRLTQSMLFEIYDDVRHLPNSLQVSGKIVRQATEVLDRLATTGGNDPRLLADVAAGYERLGSLFSEHPALRRSFNQPQAAVGHFERAVAIRQRLARRPAAELADRLAVARSLGGLAQAQMSAGDEARSVKSTDEGIRRLTALAVEAPDPAAIRFWLAVAHGHAWLRAKRSDALAPSAEPHAAAAARLWRDFVAAPSPAALAGEGFSTEAARGSAFLREAGHLEAALRLNDLAIAALDRGSGGGPGSWLAAHARAHVLDERIDTLRALDRPGEALAACKEMLRARAAVPRDPDALLSGSIIRISDGQEAAGLAAEVGDFEFAASALANAERSMAEAEERYGAPAFASARVELEWTRAHVFASQAAKASSRVERRRLLVAALDTYRAAIERAERIGGAGHVHGIEPDRLAELRRQKESLESTLRR